MLTPILMLLLLSLPCLGARVFGRRRTRHELAGAAAWGTGLLFLFTASGHFLQTQPMMEMLPPWVPGREALVYATGLLEIAIAVALFVPRWRTLGAWAATAVLIGFFPANIYAAIQQAPMGGHAWGPVYLLVRGPLQLIILGWIWLLVLGAPRVRSAGARHGFS